MIYTNCQDFKPDSITLPGMTFKVSECIYQEASEKYSTGSYDMIVSSKETMLKILDEYCKVSFSPNTVMENINIDYGDTDKQQLEKQLTEITDDYIQSRSERAIYYSTKIITRNETLTMYGGLLFLGISLGILFIMKTILIIYYKQITEGFEDKQRFEIMQNVGLSLSEVVKLIRSQILIVFFLPLLTAGMHIGFAFALIYSIIYIVTARTYYKIVKN